MTKFHFEYEFEEKLILDTVKTAFNKISSSETVRELIEKSTLNKSVQSFLTEQGMIGILSPKDGEFGMNLQLSSIIVKESGKRLVSFPLIENLLGTYLLKHDATIAADDYESGEKLTTICWNHSLTINSVDDGYSIEGTLDNVPFLDDVHAVIVPQENGQAVFIDTSILKSHMEKLEVQDITYPLYKVNVEKQQTNGETVRMLSYDREAFEQVADLLIAAELNGISQEVLDQTIDYAGEREQFGIPIGKFQAVKHMIADMYVHNESMDVSVRYGAWTIENDGEDAEVVASISKAYATDAIIQVVENGIQVHGGVGLTWEHDLHLYLKRAYRLISKNKSLFEEREKIAKHLFATLES